MKKVMQTYLSDFGLFLCTIIWGSTFVVIKGHMELVHPVVQVAYRFLLASFLMGIIVRFQTRNLFQDFRYGVLLGFFLWMIFISQTVSMKYTSATNSAFITGLAIVFLPVFDFLLFKQLPKLFRIFAGFLAVYGMWLLTGGLQSFNLGDFLNLITAVSVAVHLLLVGHFVKKVENVFVLNFQQFIVVSALSFCAAFVFQLPFQLVSFDALYSIGYLAVFATIITMSVQFNAQKYTTPMKACLIFSMEPVFAAVFAWYFAGEQFTSLKMMGAGAIFMATIISELPVDKWMRNFTKKFLPGTAIKLK